MQFRPFLNGNGIVLCNSFVKFLFTLLVQCLVIISAISEISYSINVKGIFSLANCRGLLNNFCITCPFVDFLGIFANTLCKQAMSLIFRQIQERNNSWWIVRNRESFRFNLILYHTIFTSFRCIKFTTPWPSHFALTALSGLIKITLCAYWLINNCSWLKTIR